MGPFTEQAAKTLAWEFESRKSIETRTRTLIHNQDKNTGVSQDFDTLSEHYIETATGRRFYEFRALKGDEIVQRSLHYGDGTKFADVDYRPDDPETQNAIFINRQFWMEGRNDRRQVPQPFLYLYVGREPLHEALPKATHLGQDKVIGRECEIFLFPQVRWAVTQDQVYYLDKATSIPLRVESYRDTSARERNEPISSWTARSLDEVQGHFVPLNSSQVSYNKEGAEDLTWDFKVESIEFNKDYPNSLFWPTVQPGTTVFDSIMNKMSETPGQRKSDVKQSEKAIAQPIYADPPRDWTATASSVSLVLGAAVLLTGTVLWWRRG
jgi:hypothetical protein